VEEMLHFHHLKLANISLAATSMNTVVDCDAEAMILNDDNTCLGRSEPMLANIVTPEEDLRSVVEEEDFLNTIKLGYAKHSAWLGILENPTQFPKFKVIGGLIYKLNDLGECHLVLLDVIQQGEKATGIAIQHAHKILGHLGFQKTLDYICRYYWSTMVHDMEKFVSSCRTCQATKR
jgi:hypothetical protein